MNDRPFNAFHQHFPMLKPPLAATPEVGCAIAASIAGHTARGLVLGVTPALTGLCDDVTAIDWSGPMIARVWQGDTERSRAIEADWRAMPVADGAFTAVVGDGSFNCLDYPNDYERVFAELARVLTPGARFAVRFFTTLARCETLGEMHHDVMAGNIVAIDALKWRVGMAIASSTGNANVSRADIHAAFERTFPDCAALLDATGWPESDLTAIDWYKGVTDTISFPTEKQVLAAVPRAFRDGRFVSSGTYELAERCPILAMEFAP